MLQKNNFAHFKKITARASKKIARTFKKKSRTSGENSSVLQKKVKRAKTLRMAQKAQRDADKFDLVLILYVHHHVLFSNDFLPLILFTVSAL